MTDRYFKSVLTVNGLLALPIPIVHSISAGFFSAHAQTKPQRRCVWTSIVDQGRPNIGEDGKQLSEEGWGLKAGGSNTYFFERCAQ